MGDDGSGGSISIGSSPLPLESTPDPNTSSSSSTGGVGSTVGEEEEEEEDKEVCRVESGRDAVSSGSADVTDTDISGVAPSVLPLAEELAGRVETAVGVLKKVSNGIVVEATVAGEAREVARGKCEDAIGVLAVVRDRGAVTTALVALAVVVETS